MLSTYAGMNKKLIRVFEQHYNDNCVDFYHRISIISPFYTVVRDYAILAVGFFSVCVGRIAQRQTGGEALNFVFPSTRKCTCTPTRGLRLLLLRYTLLSCVPTRNSADADKPRDAFRGQSRSPNIVQFDILCMISY